MRRNHPLPEANVFFEKLEDIFHDDDYTKAQVVKAIKQFYQISGMKKQV